MALVQIPAPQAGGMTLLSTTALSGTSVLISSISQDYNHLYVVVDSYSFAAADQLAVRFNDDSGTNGHYYCYSKINAATGGADGGRSTAARLNEVVVATTATNNLTTFTIENYVDTSTVKGGTFMSFYTGSLSGVGFGQQGFIGYNNTNNAITSLRFLTVAANNFSGGNVYIYGVK